MLMNKKAQFHAVREIFQFGLGVILLSSIMYMFYNSLIPSVADYSMELEADNINSHVNYLLSNLLGLVDEGLISGSITLEYSMPASLGDYDYTTYFSTNNICTFINSISLVKCLEIDLNDVSAEGAYLSGGELKLKVTKTASATSVVMTN